jgi:cell division septal protein FtsQ
MKGKIMGLVVTALIVWVLVAISWRVAPIKKIVFGA